MPTPPTTLWYDSDEVNDFHPHVENVLNTALSNLNLADELKVVHHPAIPGSSTVPDFGIVARSGNRYIAIIEVKTKTAAVKSERYWIQAQAYVTALDNFWKPTIPKYFAITNIEETILFANKNEHVTRCLLKDGHLVHGQFKRGDEEVFNEIKDSFLELMEKFITQAYEAITPEYIENWPVIIDSFIATYSGLQSHTSISNEIERRDLTLYEMLRLLFYYYLKSVYRISRHSHASVFRNINYLTQDSTEFTNSLINNFNRVLSIDFKQLFLDHSSSDRIIPGNLTNDQFEYLKKLASEIDSKIETAVLEQNSPEVFFNLLTEKIYSREELHSEGKVMTDPALAAILAELAIDNSTDKVIDPGMGDGSLLDAAYNRILIGSATEGVSKTHNEILAQLSGCDIDSFLSQLSTFRLLAKNFDNVDQNTEVDIIAADTFQNPRPEEFDSVVMNPPFLRNDDDRFPITSERKEIMLNAISEQGEENSFIDNVRQPNLYYYFVSWIFHYLKNGGKASVILMAKFLNNVDGVHLKNYIKKHLTSVILYPANYFDGFRVTTCITNFEKNTNTDKVKFLKIINPVLIEDPAKIKNILSQDCDDINADFTLKIVEKDNLEPEKNWKLFLIDPKNSYQKLESLSILKQLDGGLFNEIKRGGAENNGGSKTIFLNQKCPIAQYQSNIEPEFICKALQNNKVSSGSSRHYIIEENEYGRAILLPAPTSDLSGFPEGLSTFIEAAQEYYTTGKWKKIWRAAYNSSSKPDLIIPRADRAKHSIYITQTDDNILFSTNFFFCSEIKVEAEKKEKAKKIIAAYLLSAFGQIQFEMLSNNQEGMRKMEGFMIKQLKSIDPSILTEDEMDNIITKFEEFNNQNVVVRGNEGVASPRRELDLAIASAILNHEIIPEISTAENLTNFVELFLEELVLDRITL